MTGNASNSPEGKKSGQGRKKIHPDERLKVWVRAGGRCIVCNRYLLEGELSFREMTFGELAHIIGQTKSDKSARSYDDLDEDLRDLADNIVLICDDEHSEIDKQGSRDQFSVELLRSMKQRHEERIHHVTGLAEDQRTAPVRMVAKLYGNSVEVDRDAAAGAVIRGAQRFPIFPMSYRDTIEIDLRGVPGEEAAGPDYYQAATAIIDQVIQHKLDEGVAAESLKHLSVFAFARIPLLVYLGWKLGDSVPTDIYQRHRSTEAWEWPDLKGDTTFDVITPASGSEGADAVLIINLSGTIHRDELPTPVNGIPVFEIAAQGERHPDVFTGPGCVKSFMTAARQMLAELEADHKATRVLHVFAAMPVSAGVALGRVFDPAVHPALEIYQRRADKSFEPALTVGSR